ncbi:hypothetical protein [Aliisedimentitalea scapharcae]
MFNLCCQIEWYKRDSIANQLKRQGHIDRDILVGIGPDNVADEFLNKGSETVTENIKCAIGKNYRRIRVYTPCNGLSDLTREIVARGVASLAGESYGDQLRSEGECSLPNGILVEFSNVAQKVVRRISRKSPSQTVLVLGTKGVNDIYRKQVNGTGLSVFPLNKNDFKLIDDAIVASIGKSADHLNSIKSDLMERIVSRFRATHPLGPVLEACTDFSFGLGENTLRIFAEEMVNDVYGS